MWNDEERSQEDRAGSRAVLSSWVIVGGILAGITVWTGIEAMTLRAPITAMLAMDGEAH